MTSPAFQFYPADFLSDENVVVMDNRAVGCYIKLLCYCWREGSIPKCPEKLARLCGEDNSVMELLITQLYPCFVVSPDDPTRMIHKRLDAERLKQEKHRLMKSEAGKRGMKTRWSGHKKKTKQNYNRVITQLITEDNSSSSSSNSNTPIVPNDNFDIFWNAYPRHTSKQSAHKAWSKLQPDATLLDTILKAIAAQKDLVWRDKELQYIPHPATWLNSRRWEDEVEPKKQDLGYKFFKREEEK